MRRWVGDRKAELCYWARHSWPSVVLLGLYLVAMVVVILWVDDVRTGVCALRADLQRRVATSKAYLEEHPEGFAGIPASVIRKSIRDQQRTIDTLGGIRCPSWEP